MQKITPCLWFDGDAEEAARLYVSLIPNSRIDSLFRSPVDTPSGAAGTLLSVNFTLAGSPFTALNGGSQYKFNEAISFQIPCDTQREVDQLWSALGRDGTILACGWLRDRWGVTWQIFPKRLIEMIEDQDLARARRAMESMMTMTKIDLPTLEKAFAGT